jgi:hypothetical protein
MIRLRFVTGSSTVSTLIRLQERTTMPFTPSHVEAVMPDGSGYLGAHYDGGVMVRPVGYDQATMTNELFVDLPNPVRTFASGSPFIAPDPDTQADRFYAYLRSKLGAPYDWKSILDFIDPRQNLHDSQHVICSALQTLALRACGWFPAPLPVPAHQISPRDLLLCIGGRVAIEGV